MNLQGVIWGWAQVYNSPTSSGTHLCICSWLPVSQAALLQTIDWMSAEKIGTMGTCASHHPEVQPHLVHMKTQQSSTWVRGSCEAT